MNGGKKEGLQDIYVLEIANTYLKPESMLSIYYIISFNLKTALVVSSIMSILQMKK